MLAGSESDNVRSGAKADGAPATLTGHPDGAVHLTSPPTVLITPHLKEIEHG